MNDISWLFVESCNKVIAKSSDADLQTEMKNRKIKFASKIKRYSISENTKHLIEVRDDYVNGKISEEEAKAVFLSQKLNGNAF